MLDGNHYGGDQRSMEQRDWHVNYDEGVSTAIDYSKLNIPQIFRQTVERFGDRPALVFLNCKLTYTELGAEVDKCAIGFSKLGVKMGTRIAIQLPNIPQAAISYLAALQLGAEVVMTNPLYTFREVEHQWKDSGCEVAVTADFIWDDIIKDRRAELAPTRWVVASIPGYLRFPLNFLAPLKLKKQDPPRWAKVAPEADMIRFKDMIKDASGPVPRPDFDWDQVAALQYTGGTTGPSKGAMLTHKNLSSNIQQIDGWFTGVEYGQEVLMTALPLFHVFGMSVCMGWGMASGACMVLLPNPRDLPSVVKAIVKHKITLFPGVPALFNGLNNFPGIEQTDVSSIKYCFSGSAPLPPDVMQKFESMTGSKIVEGFGMSETSPVTHCNPLNGVRKPGSVGIPVADTDARIVDIETGTQDVPQGEEGELIVKGPQVMKGYWGRPDETANSIRDGWMHTGDLATMDEEGYFRIVGRKKDMINCSGFKVFPDEVDGVLVAHEAILEAATIGVPHEEYGETVKSFIVLNAGMTLSVEAVQEYCRENLAKYKVPRLVEFIDELPKSSVLKVLRRELRDMEMAKAKG